MQQYIKGLVSVIMPTYRRFEKLTRAIESVLGQTYSNIELLLINDNDPNDKYTKELLIETKKYIVDGRFRLIMQEKHVNGAVARNVGIKQAKGEYIAFLDDDDWWKEEKLEKQVHEMELLNEDWGGVSCRIEQYSNDKLITKCPKYRDGYVYKDILMLNSDFATGTLLLKHEALDSVGYFNENLLRHQDLQLLVNFTYKYKLKQLDEYLHCCDISDIQNRPNVEKLITYKKEFFQSVNTIINKLSKNEKSIVYAMHEFEVGYVMLKNGDIFKGLKKCLVIFKTPSIFYFAMKKIKNKIAIK